MELSFFWKLPYFSPVLIQVAVRLIHGKWHPLYPDFSRKPLFFAFGILINVWRGERTGMTGAQIMRQEGTE